MEIVNNKTNDKHKTTRKWGGVGGGERVSPSLLNCTEGLKKTCKLIFKKFPFTIFEQYVKKGHWVTMGT